MHQFVLVPAVQEESDYQRSVRVHLFFA
jgi:hypothetical protein